MFYPALILRRHYHGLLDEPTVLVLPAALFSKLRRFLRSSPEGMRVGAVCVLMLVVLSLLLVVMMVLLNGCSGCWR